MTRRLFGTDGIRGKSNSDPMTAEMALKVGMAAGLAFMRGDNPHRVVIGKDTRLSGYMIENALTAGFTSVGMEVFLFGPLPTPAVAMLTRSLRADIGVMISASHNMYQDNGIKLFGPDGYKLSDEVEAEIEKRMESGLANGLARPNEIGRAKRIDDAQARYIEFVKASFPRHLRLDGLRIVVDCANGAGYKVAPAVLWELGAEVITIGVEPNGQNINLECGTTAPSALRAKVRETRADLGIALDGDADRVLLVDERGQIIDGDQLIALIARAWARTNRLSKKGAVATVMSNLGLERFLADLGLTLERTAVGDRYVVEHMRKHGFNLGGEASGHIVLSDYSTTGDGLIAALQVLAILAETRARASDVCHLFEPVPQILRNVPVLNGLSLEDKPIKLAIEAGTHKLSNRGRLVIRKSGTEPLIRVMAEGDDAQLIRTVVGEIVTAIERAGHG